MANRSRFLLAILLLVATATFADPPGRVGRISYVQGDVSFRTEDRAESTAAAVNWPVTGRNVVATAPYSRAEVRIGSTAVRLDGATELEFAALDDERIVLRLVSGSIVLRVRNREHAGELEILAANGRVLFADTGRYRLDFDPGRDTARLVVHEGAARFDGPGAALAAGPGQQAEIPGGQGESARLTAALGDEFDDWSLARDRRDDTSTSARYVSPETTGYDELDAHGDWRESLEYGPVWYPRAVAPGWVPYRDGRWAWIEPWGWTWVDFAPWGFAPFHYGRWALVGGVWGWVPGRIVPRPVYAPALVAWVGRPGFNVSVSIGSVPAVGWFPLAPREIFHPGYRVSPAYVRNINVTHVTRVVEVDRHPSVHARHANRPHALTVVPAQTVSGGQPVRGAAVQVRDRGGLAALPVAATAPEAARPPSQAIIERREGASPADRQAQRSEPRGIQPEPTVRIETPQPRADRQAAPQPRAERQQVPQPQSDPRPNPQAREAPPRARVEAAQPRVERQLAPEPRVAARTIERRFVPQPRVEPQAVPHSRVDPARMRAEPPQPRADRQHVPEPRVTSQPRAEPRALAQPRVQPPAPRAESPRAARPHQRQEGERRGSRDGGR